MYTSLKTIDNPENTQTLLDGIEKASGIRYNIFSDMAHSQLPIRVYNYAQALIYKEATLMADEINLIQLAVSVENSCHFCVPAHAASALNKFKSRPEIVDAIRKNQPGPDTKINALVRLATELVRQRGQIDDSIYRCFFEHGYTKEQLFEILTIIAYKTITNYTSTIMNTQPNKEHQAYSWSANGEA